MGDHRVHTNLTKENRTAFLQHLLKDIRAIEYMSEHQLFEKDVRRIGAEQEFCLITDQWRPARNAIEVLKDLDDPHFTTELARFNLEINLDPIAVSPECFGQMKAQLKALLNKAQASALKHGSRVLLTGILPTISKNELELEYITPLPRYRALNEMMRNLRGGDFELRLRGVDEISIKHESVLLEACNTSFQMHLQVDAESFIQDYNWAQAISGPVLGVCVNSPLLFGRELWTETRIALFQQSIDTRLSSYSLKEQMSRVTFGQDWAKGTVADIFKDDLSRYKVVLSRNIEEDSLAILKEGGTPKLQALSTFNGTIYKWNRPCYGITNGKPHLRIENRYIPAGPSVIDQMANFAFWVGLMLGRPDKYDDLNEWMDFRDAKLNFFKAARTGKESVMVWGEERFSVRDLVLEELIPIAYQGLKRAGVSNQDAQDHLDIIEQRARKFTGAQWTLRSFRKLRKSMKKDDALLMLTESIYNHQLNNLPVHQWNSVEVDPERYTKTAFCVEHIMSTQLITVNENDLAELATEIMEWNKIRHLPVEDDKGTLVGLLTHTHISRYRKQVSPFSDMAVGEIMARDVVTVEPKTPIAEAIWIMKENEFGCLPVTFKEHLVGIITVKDVIPFDHE